MGGGSRSVSFSHFPQSTAIIAFLTGNKSQPSGLTGSRIFNRNVAGLPVVPLGTAPQVSQADTAQLWSGPKYLNNCVDGNEISHAVGSQTVYLSKPLFLFFCF